MHGLFSVVFPCVIRMLGVFSTFDVALGLLPGVGLVCLHSQLPPPPPGLLTDWEFSKIDCMAVYVGIKLTFDVLGENPLYADIDCHTVLTSLPSPACRGSCGLVLALATTSGRGRLPRHEVRDGRDLSSTNHRRVRGDVTSGGTS